MKVLFIGGSGIISSACSTLAVEQGIELTVLNRGESSLRPLPVGVEQLKGDIRNPEMIRKIVADRHFNCVVEWFAFTPQHIEQDISIFRGLTDQYLFISSASAYHTPPLSWPIVESTPLYNPFWEYSRNKIACEERLVTAYREEGFPITIVRPSHTYDATTIPLHGGYTNLYRIKQGKPLLIHGDGTSLWTLTHHKDFAKGLVGLLGNPKALGEAIHITSDEALTWNAIAGNLASAMGKTVELVHVPSDIIARYDKEWGAGLLGDKAHSMIFDNSKIKRLVPGFQAVIPFSQGASEITSWYEASSERQAVDPELDHLIDKIIADSQKVPL